MTILETFTANERVVTLCKLRPTGKKPKETHHTGQSFTYGIYLDKKQYVVAIRLPHARWIFDGLKEILSEIPRKHLK